MPVNINKAELTTGQQMALALARRPIGDVTADPQALARQLGRLTIIAKDRGAVKFTPNLAQRDAISQILAVPGHKQKRVLVLKARQLGFSTLIQGWAYALARYLNHARLVTISHETGATERLHSKNAIFLEMDPAKPPMKHNRTGAIEFADTKSTHYIGTAGSRAFGRGDTLHYIHASEVAFWPDADNTMTGLMEALTKDGYIFAESTPNGIGGYFYDLWQNAPGNGWLPLFYPWWWEPDYRLDVIDPDEVLPLHPEEEYLVQEHGLDLAQIQWRRDKMRTLRDKFKQEYPEDPISCFLASGSPYFDQSVLRQIEKTTISSPIEDERGLRIWRDFDSTSTYSAGVDVAEGLAHGDYSVAIVIDNRTGEQVAKLRGQWPIDYFCRAVANLGQRYGNALLAVERNNHGHAALNVLINQLKYENLYRHDEYSVRLGEHQSKYGWTTTSTSKPVMLSDLDAGLGDGTIVVRDAQTLGELRTMNWDGKGGVNAVSGCHDDDVIALAIANQARKLPQRFQVALDYLSQPNPYSGKSYKELLEIINEDG